MRKLYHRDVYWIKTFDAICNKMLTERDYVYTCHFQKRCVDKKLNNGLVSYILQCLRDGIIKNYEIFEVENGDKYIEKFAIRTNFTQHEDLCIVFSNAYDHKNKVPYLKVVTAWTNDVRDSHNTLDKKKYYCPKEK